MFYRLGLFIWEIFFGFRFSSEDNTVSRKLEKNFKRINFQEEVLKHYLYFTSKTRHLKCSKNTPIYIKYISSYN